MVNLRKLVAFDMAYHGATFIVGEFALGILGPIGLGIFFIFRAGPLIGWYLIGIGCNYIPLFLYSIIIAKKGSARTEAAYELEHKKTEAKKYGLGQIIILVPFLLIALAPYQELTKKPRAGP